MPKGSIKNPGSARTTRNRIASGKADPKKIVDSGALSYDSHSNARQWKKLEEESNSRYGAKLAGWQGAKSSTTQAGKDTYLRTKKPK